MTLDKLIEYANDSNRQAVLIAMREERASKYPNLKVVRWCRAWLKQYHPVHV